jgi:hypothetical protein
MGAMLGRDSGDEDLRSSELAAAVPVAEMESAQHSTESANVLGVSARQAASQLGAARLPTM